MVFSFSWPRRTALLCSGGEGILDPNSYGSWWNNLLPENGSWDEWDQPPWECCPMGFCLRESLAFRTVIPLVLPILLRTWQLRGRNGVGSGREVQEEIYAQKKKRKEGKLNKKSTEFYETELLFMWKFLVVLIRWILPLALLVSVKLPVRDRPT